MACWTRSFRSSLVSLQRAVRASAERAFTRYADRAHRGMVGAAVGLHALPVHTMRVDHGQIYLAFDQACYVGFCPPGPAVAIEALGHVVVVGERWIAIAD